MSSSGIRQQEPKQVFRQVHKVEVVDVADGISTVLDVGVPV